MAFATIALMGFGLSLTISGALGIARQDKPLIAWAIMMSIGCFLLAAGVYLLVRGGR